MKRDIIIIEDKAVSVTGNEVWMTATEIAGLFHTTVPAVNAAIKAVRNQPCAVAFRLNTYNTHLFRTWLVGKALSKDNRQAYVMFIQNGKVGYC